MFERFSKEARAAVIAAQEVALELGSPRIDTRHLLVALAEAAGPARTALEASASRPDELAAECRRELQTGGMDADALASLGIDLDQVRQKADTTFGTGALDGTRPRRTSRIAFDRGAKKALELALREAIRLNRRSIDSGALLLGLLRADNPARRVLERSGADLTAVRGAVEAGQAGQAA